MRDLPALLLGDPTLRMLGLGILLFGSVAASLVAHQSLLAVEVFGLTNGGYALLLLAATASSVLASVAMGVAADRGPRRRTMALLAAGLTLAGAALVAAAGSGATFVLAHALLVPAGGAMFGQLFAAGRLASARHPPALRPGILAALRALFAVPWVVLLPLWGLAFRAGLPLRAVYPAVTLLALLHLLLVWRAWPRDDAAPWDDPKSGLSPLASLHEMSSRPLLLRVALVGAIHAGPATMAVLVGLVFAAAGRGAGDVGLFFGLFVAVEVAGTLLAGALAPRLPRLGLIAAGAALYALFLALLPVLAPTPWLWLLVLPVGLGGGLVFTLAIAYLQDLLAARPGAGGSLLAVQRVVAEGLSATLFGLGSWAGGYAAVGLLAAAATLLATVALLRIDAGR
jgi:SET family sugar efflux transporter-like MFS transporter